ncbi:MAG: hypothetical protein MI922_23945, partial [Bacteroidales bacterium]|nr:hypothetical protein [Bacteroidales bacterium]
MTEAVIVNDEKEFKMMGVKHLFVWLGIVLVGCLSCVPVQQDPNTLISPPPPPATPQVASALVKPEEKEPEASPKRFQNSMDETTTSAESVVQLADRYAALVAEASVLRQENKRLLEEDARKERQLEELRVKLTKTETELTEANDLLMEILGEMNKWKNDVLGFREEMRQ